MSLCLIRGRRRVGRGGNLRRFHAAVHDKGQVRPLDQDDFLFVSKEAIDQGRTGADSRAIHDVSAYARPAAVPVIATIYLLSHADAGARPGSDSARDGRALGGVLLALAATLDRALLVAAGLGARISPYVLE